MRGRVWACRGPAAVMHGNAQVWTGSNRGGQGWTDWSPVLVARHEVCRFILEQQSGLLELLAVLACVVSAEEELSSQQHDTDVCLGGAHVAAVGGGQGALGGGVDGGGALLVQGGRRPESGGGADSAHGSHSTMPPGAYHSEELVSAPGARAFAQGASGNMRSGRAAPSIRAGRLYLLCLLYRLQSAPVLRTLTAVSP